MNTAFSSMPIRDSVKRALAELGFIEPTSIQKDAIPLLLAGKDVAGQSKTGSGKTLAFAIPILSKVTTEIDSPQALILCPTRELCSQVATEIRKLARHENGLRTLVVCGGEPMGPQRGSLERGAQILVGTPGRVLDLLECRALRTRQIKTLVLDEADRMLDMGFKDSVDEIMAAIPKERQTVLFSATFDDSIETLVRAVQKDAVRVVVSSDTDEIASVNQRYYVCERSEKNELLLSLIAEHKPEAALVFCNLKATTFELASQLNESGIVAEALNGDLEQFDRDRVMAKFRNASTRVLIATDVAARGIDIEHLDLVVNFDMPHSPEVYVHRIGRTGRAGKSGVAVSLVTGREKYKIDAVAELMKRPLEEGSALARPKSYSFDPSRVQTLYISGGRKDKLRPGDILGALTGESGGFGANDVGKIIIHDRYSYVAVSRTISRSAFTTLSSGSIKGRKFRVELLP